MWGGTDTVDNCYFNKIDYSVADNSSIMLTIRMNGTSNVFRKNTVHRTGGSATVMVGDAGWLSTIIFTIQGIYKRWLNDTIHGGTTRWCYL